MIFSDVFLVGSHSGRVPAKHLDLQGQGQGERSEEGDEGANGTHGNLFTLA